MLGTNNILLSASPDASRAIARMDALMRHLLALPEHPRLLLIAPPHIAPGPETAADPLYERFHTESVHMNEGFRRLAGDLGIAFADAADWDVALSHDRVHFSEAGHQRFARALADFILQSFS